MGAVIVIVGFIMMVVVHEGAHFLAAKAFGMKATEAFFGFGPKLWSIRRGETEYGVKAIPLGGYVRIIGMSPFEEVPPEDEPRTYRGKPFWQKSLVVLAGIISHFIVAFVLFYIIALFWGVLEIKPTITATTPLLVSGEVIGESGLALQADDRVVAIDGIPVEEIEPGTIFEPPPGGEVVITVERDGRLVDLHTAQRVEPTPAILIGLQPGDRLVQINDRPIVEWSDFTDEAARHPGEEVTLVVERDGEQFTVRTRLAVRETPDGPVGFLGVSPDVEVVSPGVLGAIPAAGGALVDAAAGAVRGLWELVSNFGDIVAAAFGSNPEVLDEVRPVSIIGLTQISLQQPDISFNLGLIAWVNVFIGVLNVVPLYPLDGGHFAVALFEKVTGRSPDVRKLMPVAVAVFLFIVLLGLLGIYFDIVNPLPLPE